MISGLESPWHWIVLLAIVLVIFGPKRLPELGRQLGSGIRDFKSSLNGEDDEPKKPADQVDEKTDRPGS